MEPSSWTVMQALIPDHSRIFFKPVGWKPACWTKLTTRTRKIQFFLRNKLRLELWSCFTLNSSNLNLQMSSSPRLRSPRRKKLVNRKRLTLLMNWKNWCSRNKLFSKNSRQLICWLWNVSPNSAFSIKQSRKHFLPRTSIVRKATFATSRCFIRSAVICELCESDDLEGNDLWYYRRKIDSSI